MPREDTAFIIKPDDIRKSALANGIEPQRLYVPADVILTFNRATVKELTSLCNLQETDWEASKYSPYASPCKAWQGKVNGMELLAFVPPMGASPLTAFCEELVCFGAQRILLLCASWSLGEKHLKKGQIHLPSFAVGLDGTSYHYGNDKFRVSAESLTFNALKSALVQSDADWRVGGVGCCEALYRITPEMVAAYQRQECLSMENGEVAALYSLAKVHGIRVGVLLQPYIDLGRSYDMSYMDQEYEETCRMQACVAVETLKFS